MSINRKDVYSAMPDSSFGGFGKIEREREIVQSPKRSNNLKRKRKPKKEQYLQEKSLANKMLMQKSFEHSFEKRLDSIDDDALDVLFPEGNDTAIDTFVFGLNEKWLFDGIGGYIRRALKNKRRHKRRERKFKSSTHSTIVTKNMKGPCWDGYEQIGMKKGRGGKMVPMR